MVRSNSGQAPRSVPSPSSQTLDIQAIPVPPPPTVSPDAFQGRLEQDLTKQQDLTEALQEELREQKALASDLKAQLERQQDETDKMLEQIHTYQDSVESMASQQVRLIESIPRHNETQTMLLWGILGLFMLLMLGGGTVVAVFALWLMHMQQQQQQQQQGMIYPVQLPPNPYMYYQKPPLPPPVPGQQYVQYEVKPYED
ncbi:MAG: hypothetical protein ACFCVD_24465 [Nodosilinea sp.]